MSNPPLPAHMTYLSIQEVEKLKGQTTEEIWRQLETGALTAVMPAHWSANPRSTPLGFDYVEVPPQTVRIILAHRGNIVSVASRPHCPTGP